MSKSQRNYGVDFLRIISLLGVVSLHIMGHGGMLSTAQPGMAYALVWFAEIVAYPAVNCFVIISGYVGYKDEKYYPKLKNVIYLFFTVLFYSVVMTFLVEFVSPDNVSLIDIVQSFFPITTKQYWFFTVYFIMFLISPMINFYVNKADGRMLGLSFALVVIIGTIEVFTKVLFLNDGYIFIWFVFLYLIGATIKKYNINDKISPVVCVFGFCACVAITWILKIYCQSISVPLWNISNIGNVMISYCSPTVLLMGVFAFCLFSKIRPHEKFNEIIAYVSSSAFSVYLIHDNRHIRNLLIKSKFTFLTEKNPILMIVGIVVFAFAIYAVCLIIDKLRERLFNLLKIADISERIENIIKHSFGKMIK